jgi:hypothetical protein
MGFPRRQHQIGAATPSTNWESRLLSSPHLPLPPSLARPLPHTRSQSPLPARYIDAIDDEEEIPRGQYEALDSHHYSNDYACEYACEYEGDYEGDYDGDYDGDQRLHRLRKVVSNRNHSSQGYSAFFHNERWQLRVVNRGFSVEHGTLTTRIGILEPAQRVRRFGLIDLDEHPMIFKDIENRPNMLQIQAIDPQELLSLNRLQRRQTLEALAEVEATINFRTGKPRGLSRRFRASLDDHLD